MRLRSLIIILVLAAGIAGDVYVVVSKAIDSPALGVAASSAVAVILSVLWYVATCLLKRGRRQ